MGGAVVGRSVTDRSSCSELELVNQTVDNKAEGQTFLELSTAKIRRRLNLWDACLILKAYSNVEVFNIILHKTHLTFAAQQMQSETYRCPFNFPSTA